MVTLATVYFGVSPRNERLPSYKKGVIEVFLIVQPWIEIFVLEGLLPMGELDPERLLLTCDGVRCMMQGLLETKERLFGLTDPLAGDTLPRDRRRESF